MKLVSAVPPRLRALFRENISWVVAWLVVAVIVVSVIHFWPQPPSPVPPQIRSAAGFTIIYPQGYQVSPSSWDYSTSQKIVTFTATKDGVAVVFSEQRTPLAYQDDAAAYNRFIGGLRPRINFEVPLGTVSIANFVTAGDYQIVGESGILNTHNTLIVAHPQTKQPSDDQWRDVFQSLQLDH